MTMAVSAHGVDLSKMLRHPSGVVCGESPSPASNDYLKGTAFVSQGNSQATHVVFVLERSLPFAK